MPLTLTNKEVEMLSAVIRRMDKMPTIDFEKIKDEVGHKYARNARSSFNKVWDKLKAGNSGAGDVGNGTPVSVAPKPARGRKSETAGTVGPRATPRKAADGGGRGRKAKKEDPAKHEEEDHVKEEFQDETILDDSDDGKSYYSLSSTIGDQQGRFDDDYKNDMLDANLLGITIEEYRAEIEKDDDAKWLSSPEKGTSIFSRD